MYKGKKKKKKRAMKLKGRGYGRGSERGKYNLRYFTIDGKGNLGVALHYGCHPSNPSNYNMIEPAVCKVPPGKRGGFIYRVYKVRYMIRGEQDRSSPNIQTACAIGS